jgi:hypothetical protein
MFRRPNYEADDKHFAAPAYKVKGYGGVAWWVMGWETEPDEDTEWSGIEPRTGKVVCRMVGDDRNFVFDEDEITAIAREDFCGECGQIGCTHDGLDRSEAAHA